MNITTLNGRFGKDKNQGKLTFHDQSLIDITICSFNCLRLLLDFEVLETDSLVSDRHAILAWSVTTHFCHNMKKHGNNNICFKKWDQ